MSLTRVHRYCGPESLSDEVAKRLIEQLAGLQRNERVAQLCLTGGRTAQAMYERFAVRAAGAIDPARLELWWSDERFLPTDDPDRVAGPVLAVLAGSLTLKPARIHPMPGADGLVESAQAALTYAKELGDTAFDLCILGMGPDGHIASLFPGHPSGEPTTALAIGVTDAPKPPLERITLTLQAINRAKQVWLLVTGADKAQACARALAGEVGLPAARVQGREATHWFVDAEAAAGLPQHICSL